MNSDTFIQGLARVLNCSKVHVTITGLVTTWFAVRYAAADLPPTQRASLWVAFIGAVAVQLREIVNAWTEEDVARVGSQRNAPTAGSGNDARSAVSTASRSNVPIDDASNVSLLPSIPEIPELSGSSTLYRSPDMPRRTKLPVVLVGFSLIALFTGSGCQTPSPLVTYREGLYQVDEPLYEAHLLLMADAVKANLRTSADQQVVQQGITAARGLYQQSKSMDAGAAP